MSNELYRTFTDSKPELHGQLRILNEADCALQAGASAALSSLASALRSRTPAPPNVACDIQKLLRDEWSALRKVEGIVTPCLNRLDPSAARPPQIGCRLSPDLMSRIVAEEFLLAGDLSGAETVLRAGGADDETIQGLVAPFEVVRKLSLEHILDNQPAQEPALLDLQLQHTAAQVLAQPAALTHIMTQRHAVLAAGAALAATEPSIAHTMELVARSLSFAVSVAGHACGRAQERELPPELAALPPAGSLERWDSLLAAHQTAVIDRAQLPKRSGLGYVWRAGVGALPALRTMAQESSPQELMAGVSLPDAIDSTELGRSVIMCPIANMICDYEVDPSGEDSAGRAVRQACGHVVGSKSLESSHSTKNGAVCFYCQAPIGDPIPLLT